MCRMEEIWRPVAGFESHYEVSNLGNVRRKKSGRLRKIDEITIGRGNPNLGAPTDKDVFIIKFHKYENNQIQSKTS